MKKYGMLIGIVLILLIAGGVGYTQLKGSNTSKTPDTAEQKTEATNNEAKENLVTGSLKSLLGVGKSVTCFISYSEEEGGGKGTVYVSDKKMRGDFTTKVDDKEVVSHMISDGAYSYIWSGDQKEGIKVKIDESVKVTGTQEQEKNTEVQNTELDKEGDLNCTPWAVDNSKFIPPTDVKFTDFSETLKQVQVTGGPTQSSAICDQIADATAKAECLKALNK